MVAKLSERMKEVSEVADRDMFYWYRDVIEGMVSEVVVLERDSDELKQIKDYMGPAYPIFKKTLEECIKKVGEENE